MSDSTFEKVAAFHDKFGFPYLSDGATGGMRRLYQEEAITMLRLAKAMTDIRDALRQRPNSLPYYRMAFIVEEVAELMSAVGLSEMDKIADALADIDYVVAGTAHWYKIPHDLVVSEVHYSNTQKEPMKTEKPRM